MTGYAELRICSDNYRHPVFFVSCPHLYFSNIHLLQTFQLIEMPTPTCSYSKNFFHQHYVIQRFNKCWFPHEYSSRWPKTSHITETLFMLIIVISQEIMVVVLNFCTAVAIKVVVSLTYNFRALTYGFSYNMYLRHLIQPIQPTKLCHCCRKHCRNSCAHGTVTQFV